MPVPGAQRHLAWWKLPREQKALLYEQRLQSNFGGAGSIADGKAPYFWSQEFGNPRANIRPQHYITGPTGYLYQFLGTFFEMAIE